MITGNLFIGNERVTTTPQFSAVNPATGEELSPPFSTAGASEVDRACAEAAAAFRAFESAGPERRAQLLERIGDNIMALGDELLDRAGAETGLPPARLTGERARTVNQLKLFAAELHDGAWLGVRIDPALPEREPLPRPDLRTRRKALGPVAVFGASNFPLAFSVAGGDTASALAAGCPVVVKGHPAHPGTSELVAGAIASALEALDLPAGVFSLLNGTSYELGQALVADARIKAVGFTGSRQGGLALMKTAAARPEPIPVFAEMSSINPVILLPGALEERAEQLAEGYAASLTQGAGQFCTNPGLAFAIDCPAVDRFVAAASAAVESSDAAVMLTAAIHKAYEQGVERLSGNARVSLLARGKAGDGCNLGQAALLATSLEDFAADEGLSEEVFGASSLLIRCRDAQALARALAGAEGQLTASLHLTDSDEDDARVLLPVLEDKVGRIIANGWPTGVEVSHAMVHSGPFPATSDGRSTSVGTLAIERFLRPVCYQDFPESLLPAVLKGEGQAGTLRRLDGAWKVE